MIPAALVILVVFGLLVAFAISERHKNEALSKQVDDLDDRISTLETAHAERVIEESNARARREGRREAEAEPR